MNYDPYQSPAASQIPNPYASGTELSEQAVSELLGTQAWVRFVSILMMIATGLLFVSAVAPQFIMTSRSRSANDVSYLAGNLAGTLIVCLLYVYPTVLLSRYASAIRRFRINRMMTDFEQALRHQRFFWRFVGIISIIGLAIFVLAFVGMARILSGMH